MYYLSPTAASTKTGTNLSQGAMTEPVKSGTPAPEISSIPYKVIRTQFIVWLLMCLSVQELPQDPSIKPESSGILSQANAYQHTQGIKEKLLLFLLIRME